jgi:N-acetylmuramoyl-L-alanine amidase
MTGSRDMSRTLAPIRAIAPASSRPLRPGLAAWLLLLAFTLLLTLAAGPGAGVARAAGFTDVPESGSATNAIDYLVGAGVLSGYPDGTFRPDKPLNRGQATKILVLQHGVQIAQSGDHSFSDVDKAYASYVDAAVQKSWISGFADGSFRPYDLMLRQQLAVVMVRSQGWEAEAKALTPSQIATALKGVTDVSRISPTALPYVALAVSRGLFQGDAQGRLNPAEGITRAQFALVAYRAELRNLAVVTGIRFSGNHPDMTRVVIDLSAKPGGSVVHLSGSDVLTVDVSGAVAEGQGMDASVATTEVDSATAGQFKFRPPVVRISLSLIRYSRYVVTTMAPSDGYGDRIVIDIYRRSDGPTGPGGPLIALDAGHGGKDTGALGVTGVKEKDVNLTIILQVDKLLREAGLRTVLTRSGDTYPTLQERTEIANSASASLFLSVHNNAGGSGDLDASGTETFYQGSPEKYSIEGKKLAQSIQRNLLAAIGSTDRGARTWYGGELYVLGNTKMTGALTEVGFLTNAAEEAKLKDPLYLDRAARGIARGVLEYLGWDRDLVKAPQ